VFDDARRGKSPHPLFLYDGAEGHLIPLSITG
jgi:hypothetical protein